jgi:hypothetical protein
MPIFCKTASKVFEILSLTKEEPKISHNKEALRLGALG